jgi:signal transduction histidine kinase
LNTAQLRGVNDGVHDVDALRRTISHVVAFSTLSAVWAGAPRSTVAESLAKVVREALDCNAVYVGLRSTGGGPAYESKNLRDADDQPVFDAIRNEVADWLRAPAAAQQVPELGGHLAPVVVTPIGIWAEHGLIVATSRQADFPSDTHRLLLNVAANQATLALLTEYAREEQRISATLQRIGTDIAAEMDPQKVIRPVIDAMTTLTGANFAIFEPRFEGTAVVRLSDVTADPLLGQNPPSYGMPAGHFPVRSYLAVPVISRTGKVHGGLFMGHKDVGVFLERHERLAVGVAAWAALAMDNGYLYAEAQRANLAKDHFLATLSHELRTPLNAIMGWLSMLRRPEVMTPEGSPKAWAAVDRNTNGLAALIEDLLDVSRIATGKFRLVESDVDLNDVTRDSVRMVEPLFVDKGVMLSIEFSPQPCTLRGDVGRLRQVAGNLLSNAVKFTPTDGQVCIGVACEDAVATLTVTDTGIGIHPDFLPHVFERFRQGDAQSKTGLGLGLAIVKDLVELHGGTVVASSAGIGLGSRFTVTLPRTR